ncbi:MAG: cupin domain-containing protein [Pirellulales bacterium]
MNNVFFEIPRATPQEITDILTASEHVRIERIVSLGHASPPGFWYDQMQNEWVVLFQGAAQLRFEDRLVDLTPGDHVSIPAHTKHRVEWTAPNEPTIWLAVFY